MTIDIIKAITRHEGWEGCDTCPSQTEEQSCPIRENRRRMMAEDPEDPFQDRLASLIELSERNGSHFPVLQLLALASNGFLGQPDARDGLMSCAAGPDLTKIGRSDLASIYRNITAQNCMISSDLRVG